MEALISVMSFNCKSRLWAFFVFCLWMPSVQADENCDPGKDVTRIAVAGGSITEIIYALGRESQLVAVDRTSNFPAAARSLPSVGYVRNLSAEGILSLRPTLVLGEDDMGPPEVLEQLASVSVDIRTVPEAHTPEGIVEKFKCVASLLGLSEAETSPHLLEMSRSVSVISSFPELVSDQDEAFVAIILNIQSGSPIVAGSGTSGDGVISMLAAGNAFQAVEGWKPASREAFLAANPDHIVITQRGFDMAGGMDGLGEVIEIASTNAFKEGRVHVVDGMSLLGYGPRTLGVVLNLFSDVFPSAKF